MPKRFVDKYGKDCPRYSYSRCATMDTCVYEYYLSRILGKEVESNIYGVAGGIAHDILEDFYNQKIKFDEMEGIFINKFTELEILGYKFNANDRDRNKRMMSTYRENIKHFFNNHNVINKKVFTEKEVWVDICGNIFLGYIDAIYREDKQNYVILDYKTSNINGYLGDGKQKKGMQLLLYALALNQANIPLKNIKCGWNFLKYVTVKISTDLKNGGTNLKNKNVERKKWVQECRNEIKKEMLKLYTDMHEWEIDIILQQCIDKNNIDDLDEVIRNKFTINDCIIFIDVNEQNIKTMEDYLLKCINEIKERTKNNDWEIKDIDKNKSFYCTTLCGCKKYCKYYQKYLDSNNF